MQDGEIVVEKYGEKASGTYDSFLKDLAVKDENGKDACRLDFELGFQRKIPSFPDTLSTTMNTSSTRRLVIFLIIPTINSS